MATSTAHIHIIWKWKTSSLSELNIDIPQPHATTRANPAHATAANIIWNQNKLSGSRRFNSEYLHSASLPGVHPAVDNGVVHWITHREPVDAQVHLLNVGLVGQLRIVRRRDEIDLERQPANRKYNDHDHHHFHHLQREPVSALNRKEIKIKWKWWNSIHSRRCSHVCQDYGARTICIGHFPWISLVVCDKETE